MTIEPGKNLPKQAEALIARLNNLNDAAPLNATLTEILRDITDDVRALYKAYDDRATYQSEEKVRGWATNNAYLRVIQEFIAGRANPDLKKLQDLGGMVIVQAGTIHTYADRLSDALKKEGITYKTVDGKAKRLLELIEFYVFHEMHRAAWYLQKHVGRDIHLAVAGLAASDIKGLEVVDPPEPKEMPT